MKATHFCARTKDTSTIGRGKTQAVGVAVAAALLGTCLAIAPTANAYADAPATADTTGAPVAPSASALPGVFTIVNYGSGLCLDTYGAGWGEPVVQQPCDSTRPTQRWGLSRHTATRYLLVNGAGQCMDVRDGVNANGTVVQIWGCDRWVRSMRWGLTTLIPDLYFMVFSDIAGGWCLDIAGGSLQPGAQLQIYRCSSSLYEHGTDLPVRGRPLVGVAAAKVIPS